jgi:hypothetical protein
MVSGTLIRCRSRAVMGSEGGTSRLLCVPSSGRACRLANEPLSNPLELFFWPSVLLGASPPPGELLLAGTETDKVAAAKLAAIRRRAHPQLKNGPAGRVVILFGPRAQIAPQALRAARIAQREMIPDRGRIPVRALPATQRINAHDGCQPFAGAAQLRNPKLSRSALGTSAAGHF